MIEHFTYRAEGHSTSDDPSKYRPAQESEVWPFGDPVQRLKAHLIHIGEWDQEQHEAFEKEAKTFVRETYKKAEALGTVETGPQVDDFTMFEQVYADPPQILEEQREMFKRELG